MFGPPQSLDAPAIRVILPASSSCTVTAFSKTTREDSYYGSLAWRFPHQVLG